MSYDLTLSTVTGTVNNGDPLYFGSPILTVTEASVASGSVSFSEATRDDPYGSYSDPSSGFVSFQAPHLNFTNPDNTYAYATPRSTNIMLDFNAGGFITSGDITIYSDTGSGPVEYVLDLDNGNFTGNYGSDYNSACTGLPCVVTGTYSGPSGYTPVPEPSSFAMLFIGIMGSALVIRRSRRA